MQILIVEDDQKLARQLQKGLAEQGHSVILAFNGYEGLHATQSEVFDVFVVDVMLPGIDGFSLVRRLRAGGSATPILLLTARDTAEDIVMGLDAGADDYLTKPFPLRFWSHGSAHFQDASRWYRVHSFKWQTSF